MMKQFFLCLIIILGAVSSLLADNQVRTVQSRLKAGGFYSGEVNGIYDSETAGAVTRYQIRNGLQITGKLDSQTRNALGVGAGEPEAPTAKFGEDVWRYLRKSDQEYIKRLMTEDAGSSQSRQSPAHSNNAAASASPPGRMTPAASGTSPQQPAAATPPPTTNSLPSSFNRERLRDYIGAFVLAGLDPKVGAEAEFFADRVDYFGEKHVTRAKIRGDLQRYDNRWPERRFWLAGEPEVKPINDRLKVTFPLRYELRSRSRQSSGKVWKTLILEKTGADDLQIVAVNERKEK